MKDMIKVLSFLVRLSSQVRFARLRIGFVGVAGAVSGLANTAMLALITTLLSRSTSASPAMTWAFVGLCLILPVSQFLSQVLLIDLSQATLLSLRLRLCRRVLTAPLRHLESLGASRLLATLTNDIGVIVESLSLVPVLIMELAILGSCLLYLAILSWKLLLEVVVFIVVGLITYQVPVLRAVARFRRSREHYDEVIRHVRSLTEGTKELKMHRARRRAFLGAIESSTMRLQRENRAGAVIYSAAGAWGQILLYLLLGALVFVFPRFQLVPSRTLISYTIVMFQLMGPIVTLLNAFPALSRAAVSARKVEDLGFSLEAESNEPEESAGEALPDAAWGSLELRGVTHKYRRENEEESFLLGPVDLAFRPGELVFVVGGNGSGKTTLAKLLIGLYKPESGEVFFAGEPVTDANRERYREHFSVVFSDFFVFESLLGLDAAALDDEARRYLQKLHLTQKVRVEGGVLSSVDLSQGQRKRLALLTAYLENRPIYLFDEWAADQDPSFKEIFYLELLPELRARGKSVFVISHDDRYFHVADRVVKLDYGLIESDRTIAEFLGDLVEEPAGRRR